MAKIEKFKNFAQNFQRKWNGDTPTEIILPDYQSEELEKEEREIEDELDSDPNEEITEDVDWDEMRVYGEETQSHLETLFSEINEEGYYEVRVVLASASPEGLSRGNRIYIDSEIRLEPIEGKLWFRPSGVNAMIGRVETSFEKESELLRIKMRTLNKINAIIEDLKNDGCEVGMYSNRLGEIEIKLREKLDI